MRAADKRIALKRGALVMKELKNARLESALTAEREKVRVLREALGARFNADAYRESFPDNADDGRDLLRQAMHWEAKANEWLGEEEHDVCLAAAKARRMGEPDVKANLARFFAAFLATADKEKNDG